jgi:hypothetical protein
MVVAWIEPRNRINIARQAAAQVVDGLQPRKARRFHQHQALQFIAIVKPIQFGRRFIPK